jgi:hypothetical protein
VTAESAGGSSQCAIRVDNVTAAILMGGNSQLVRPDQSAFSHHELLQDDFREAGRRQLIVCHSRRLCNREACGFPVFD